MLTITERELCRYLDQTNVQPQATERDIRSFVEEARGYQFASVAIMPVWVPLATELLRGSETTIAAAVGYPLGTTPTECKVQETRWVVERGPADVELDLVMNIPMLKSGQYEALESDLRAVMGAAQGRVVKVIIELPILTGAEVVIASMLCEKVKADYVKTSTGFTAFQGWRVCQPRDVSLIKSVVGDRVKVKASGGLKTLREALSMIDAGASRIGTSCGVAIVGDYRRWSN